MEYNLELEKAVKKIKEENAKIVCLQLPEGLRTRTPEIVDTIEKETGATIVVWLGSCYGACDIPLQVESLGVDLIIQWGHSEWL